MCQKEFMEYYESRNSLLVYPLGISSLNQASSSLKVAQLLWHKNTYRYILVDFIS